MLSVTVQDLEFGGCQVAQCRVNTFGLIHIFDEVSDAPVGIAIVLVFVQIDLLFFDGANDALSVGVLRGLVSWVGCILSHW